MNKEKFFHLLQPSEPVTPSDISELEEVAQTYPYCQLAHYLVAKAHQQQENPQVSEKVKKAAVYAVDRNVLKKMLLVKPAVSETNVPPVAETNLESIPTPEPTVIPETSEISGKAEEPELTIEPPQISFFEQQSEPPVENLPAKESDVPFSTEDETAIHIRRIDKTEQNQIIDSFIKNEPRISALHKTDKQAPASNQDLSEKSIMLPVGVVSENLAGIMIKQGKIDKAIDIYEKLILKYPQKKAYFAEKIENLKNN